MTMILADGPVDDGAVSPRAERPKRRTFSAKYKLKIVAGYEAPEPGEKRALLRREGSDSSHVVEWRRARDAGALHGLASQPRSSGRSSEQVGNDALRRDNERLARELARTRAALDVVRKAHALLELLSESAEPDTRSKP